MGRQKPESASSCEWRAALDRLETLRAHPDWAAPEGSNPNLERRIALKRSVIEGLVQELDALMERSFQAETELIELLNQRTKKP